MGMGIKSRQARRQAQVGPTYKEINGLLRRVSSAWIPGTAESLVLHPSALVTEISVFSHIIPSRLRKAGIWIGRLQRRVA